LKILAFSKRIEFVPNLPIILINQYILTHIIVCEVLANIKLPTLLKKLPNIGSLIVE
jgi:hypothetical protein